MGKKDRCVVFGFNNDRLFPEINIYSEVLFRPKSAREY